MKQQSMDSMMLNLVQQVRILHLFLLMMGIFLLMMVDILLLTDLGLPTPILQDMMTSLLRTKTVMYSPDISIPTRDLILMYM